MQFILYKLIFCGSLRGVNCRLWDPVAFMRHELDVRTVIIKANALELPTHFQPSVSAEIFFISQAVDYSLLFFFSCE